MKFKVKTNTGKEYIVGAESNKHLEISIRISSETEVPTVEGRAYVFDGDEFTKHLRWDITTLQIGETVQIQALDDGITSEPSKIEFSNTYRRKQTAGTKAFIKDQIEKTKERIKEIQEFTYSSKNEQCSFCGKLSGEVKRIIPTTKSAICNECVEMCNKILREENA